MVSKNMPVRFEVYAPDVKENKIVSYNKIADIDTDTRSIKIHDSQYSKDLQDVFNKERQIFTSSVKYNDGVGDVAKKVKPWEQENVMEIINRILPAMGFKVKLLDSQQP